MDSECWCLLEGSLFIIFHASCFLPGNISFIANNEAICFIVFPRGLITNNLRIMVIDAGLDWSVAWRHNFRDPLCHWNPRTATSHCGCRHQSNVKWQIARFVHANDEKIALEEIRKGNLTKIAIRLGNKRISSNGALNSILRSFYSICDLREKKGRFECWRWVRGRSLFEAEFCWQSSWGFAIELRNIFPQERLNSVFANKSALI